MHGSLNGIHLRRAYGVSEFSTMFGISTDSAKRAIKRGDLHTIRLGGRRLIPASEIARIEREGFAGGTNESQPDSKSLGSGEQSEK